MIAEVSWKDAEVVATLLIVDDTLVWSLSEEILEEGVDGTEVVSTGRQEIDTRRVAQTLV